MELLDSDALLSQVARPRNQQIKGLQRCEPFVFQVCAVNVWFFFVFHGRQSTEALRMRRQVIRGQMRVSSPAEVFNPHLS
jgi:hypothetical protein